MKRKFFESLVVSNLFAFVIAGTPSFAEQLSEIDTQQDLMYSLARFNSIEASTKVSCKLLDSPSLAKNRRSWQSSSGSFSSLIERLKHRQHSLVANVSEQDRQLLEDVIDRFERLQSAPIDKIRSLTYSTLAHDAYDALLALERNLPAYSKNIARLGEGWKQGLENRIERSKRTLNTLRMHQACGDQPALASTEATEEVDSEESEYRAVARVQAPAAKISEHDHIRALAHSARVSQSDLFLKKMWRPSIDGSGVSPEDLLDHRNNEEPQVVELSEIHIRARRAR